MSVEVHRDFRRRKAGDHAAEEFEDMRDDIIDQNAMAHYRAGRSEASTIDEVRKLLEAPTPLAFWRAKRAVT